MHTLLNARWGYTGDLGSFPCDGINIVELTIKTEDDKIKYIFFTHADEYGDLSIRDRSAFDGILSGSDLSFGEQNIWFHWNKLRDGWNKKDPMFSVINLGLHMLKKTEELYYSFEGHHPPMEYDGAHTYVKDWHFKNLDECDIPLFTNGDKDDDGWDGEEELS